MHTQLRSLRKHRCTAIYTRNLVMPDVFHTGLDFHVCLVFFEVNYDFLCSRFGKDSYITPLAQAFEVYTVINLGRFSLFCL